MSYVGVSAGRICTVASAAWAAKTFTLAFVPMSVRELGSLVALVCGVLIVLMAT